MKVAIVERELVGGECSYYACMPSKALLRPADVLAEARRIPGVPVDAERELDPQAILDRRDEVIHDLDDSAQLPWLEERGIDLFRGVGRFDGERRVAVGDDVLAPRKAVVVATGSGAAMPPIDGLDRRRRLEQPRGDDRRSRCPESMIVLGGGPVGCELAQAWASAGHQGDPDRGRRAAARAARSRSPASRSPRHCASASASTSASAPRSRRSQRRRRRRRRRARRRRARSRPRRSSSPSAACPTPPRLGLELGRRRARRARLPRDRRPPAGRRPRVALRDRRRQRPRPPHPRRQVPGLGRGREPARPRRRGDRGRASARRASPSPTRRSPPSARRSAQAREAGIDARAIDVPTDGTAGASFQGKDTGGTSRLVIDQASQDDRRRHLHRLRDRRLPPRRDDRDRRRGAARRACATRSPPSRPAARSG